MSPYISSLRLRTLPLSMSGIILGFGLAMSVADASWTVFVLAILTTVSLQILSNLCNELGDAQKGTDTHQTGRKAYGLQAGTITVLQIKKIIVLFIVLSIIFGSALIYCAFGSFCCLQSIVFFGLGTVAIIGAMTYTLGKHSYGYIGLGDLGVFLFFGFLSTVGSYYLQTQAITTEIVWIGAAIGFPCVGVLNLNNIRDMRNDRIHGKHTFASYLGPIGARLYHACLLIACLVIFAWYGHWWTCCIVPVWAWHLWYLFSHNEHLDRQMPVLMFSTLLVALLGII